MNLPVGSWRQTGKQSFLLPHAFVCAPLTSTSISTCGFLPWVLAPVFLTDEILQGTLRVNEPSLSKFLFAQCFTTTDNQIRTITYVFKSWMDRWLDWWLYKACKQIIQLIRTELQKTEFQIIKNNGLKIIYASFTGKSLIKI